MGPALPVDDLSGRAGQADVTQVTSDLIAGSGPFRTDREVQTLNEHIKARHAVNALRRPPTIHPDAAPAMKSAAAPDGVVLAIPTRAPRVRASLHCSQPHLDSKRRVAMSRVALACGWPPGTEVGAHTGTRCRRARRRPVRPRERAADMSS
jgi:hypothetical protein